MSDTKGAGHQIPAYGTNDQIQWSEYFERICRELGIPMRVFRGESPEFVGFGRRWGPPILSRFNFNWDERWHSHTFIPASAAVDPESVRGGHGGVSGVLPEQHTGPADPDGGRAADDDAHVVPADTGGGGLQAEHGTEAPDPTPEPFNIIAWNSWGEHWEEGPLKIGTVPAEQWGDRLNEMNERRNRRPNMRREMMVGTAIGNEVVQRIQALTWSTNGDSIWGRGPGMLIMRNVRWQLLNSGALSFMFDIQDLSEDGTHHHLGVEPNSRVEDWSIIEDSILVYQMDSVSSDIKLDTAQRLALAVLQGDKAAAKQLADMITETHTQTVRELVPVQKITASADRVRVVAFADDPHSVDLGGSTLEVEVERWLRGERKSLGMYGINRIEIYELPEGWNRGPTPSPLKSIVLDSQFGNVERHPLIHSGLSSRLMAMGSDMPNVGTVQGVIPVFIPPESGEGQGTQIGVARIGDHGILDIWIDHEVMIPIAPRTVEHQSMNE